MKKNISISILFKIFKVLSFVIIFNLILLLNSVFVFSQRFYQFELAPTASYACGTGLRSGSLDLRPLINPCTFWGQINYGWIDDWGWAGAGGSWVSNPGNNACQCCQWEGFGGGTFDPQQTQFVDWWNENQCFTDCGTDIAYLKISLVLDDRSQNGCTWGGGTCDCCGDIEGDPCPSGCCNNGMSCSSGHCCIPPRFWDSNLARCVTPCEGLCCEVSPWDWVNIGTSCGDCGTTERQCDVNRQYTNNYRCVGTGATSSCGNCGTRSCDANGNWGACTGEGCAPNSWRCSNDIRQQCSATCTWNNVENCNNRDGWGCFQDGNRYLEYYDYYCRSSDVSCQYTTTSSTDCDASDTNSCIGSSRYFNNYYCSGGQSSCSLSTSLIENCDSYDGWVCSGNTKEYRDYGCTPGACTYTITSTQNCDSLDGATCSGDIRQINDYSCSAGSCVITSQTTENCNNYDGSNYCNGNFRQLRNYFCSGGSCTFTGTNLEDCAAKASTDSDGSPTAFQTAGTVTDYVTCSGGSCTSNSLLDTCSGSTLQPEYGASGSGVVSQNKNCEDFESNYCSGDRLFRNEWTCSGSPGACVDTTDTAIGTNADGDAKDKECGDSLCDNAAGVFDSTRQASETTCNDGLDNDCDGLTDGTDPDCAGRPCPGGTICCQNAGNCPQDDCKSESCVANVCVITDRSAGDTTECGTCQACNVAGGDCTAISANDGKNCAGGCTYCSAGSCLNRAAGATDECSTCQSCNVAGGSCIGISAETGKNCASDCFDCVSGTCTPMTESNDNGCNDDCTTCSAGSCVNRAAAATDECSTCQQCNAAGGDCAGITATDGKNCANQCTSCSSGSCVNRNAGDTTECSTCQSCNAGGGSCAAVTAETGKGCTSDCNDCVSGSCTATTESNDGGCNDDCTSCSSGSCINRNQCNSAECSAGSYCNSAGGDCKTPDENENVCLSCVPDQTSGLPWTWSPSNHQDAGKSYNSNLFNSNGATCPQSSCSKSNCACYDANGNAVNHLGLLSSGNCCGDDASEFFKPDYFGPECASDANSCIWSTGDAQASNTGNAEWWCFTHEWSQCIDSSIGARVGGVTCAGVNGNNRWTPNSQVLPESSYSCIDGKDNDGDGTVDCADSDCAGLTGPGGVICCQPASVFANCGNDDCIDEQCVANICQNGPANFRSACDQTECTQTGVLGTSTYCNAPGGNCMLADNDANVCTLCVPDSTSTHPITGQGLRWVWGATGADAGPQGIFEDGGKAYSTNTHVFTTLFDSNGGPCLGNSCNKTSGCSCYDSSAGKKPVKHLPALTTGNCCGDDPNEFYKSDYYGGECVSSIAQCVWSTGHVQPANTGNAEWWCNPGNWWQCTDSTIGQHDPPAGMCCAGIVGSNAWTPNPLVLPENQYSCTDGKDNDCDGQIDCDDFDCAGSVGGYVKNQNENAIFGVFMNLMKTNSQVNQSATTDTAGKYNFTITKCGTWDVSASHPDYWPEVKSGVAVNPNQAVRLDYQLQIGTSCEPDCTFVEDDIVHASCDGRNGCAFCDATARAACDNSKPGWLRDYDDNNYVVCAPGCPQPKVEVQASLACSSNTIVKVIRIVVYNGKPVKLVVASCG